MRLMDLAQASADVASVGGRLDKIARLADLLSRLEADEIEPAASFLTGTTRHGRIGIGQAAIRSGTDARPAESSTLNVLEVDDVFARIAALSGKGAAAARARALSDLFARGTVVEQDFLRRLMYGELRQGALAGVLTDAIARAAGAPVESVRRAAMVTGDLPAIARLALTGGTEALSAASIQLMRPIQPMLAATGEDVGLALAAFETASLEYKLDGARIQVHKQNDEVRIFSRTLNDVTASAPEVVEIVRAMPARELILDGEVIALAENGRPHPFQVTMRRFGRTREVEQARRELPLTPFFFDALYMDGQSLLDEPLGRRAGVLGDIAASVTVPRLMTPAPDEAERFVVAALARGHEGVMAKDLASPYAAGRRGAAWLKIKQARTLDLVVLAAEWGNGRRQGWLSNLHLGARDPDHGAFVMLGKTFKGMTDEMLAWQTEQLLSREIARDARTVHVRPELVVEVAFNEIQQSSTYAGGLTLRFARIKRYRTDKTATDADTIATVRAMAATGA